MADTVLLTGRTGFLGTELAARLIRRPQLTLYTLVRAASEAEAVHRLRSAWHHAGDLCGQIGKRVFPVPGDFTEPELGLCEKHRKLLQETVTLLIHSGAEISFRKNREEFFRVNTDGTEKMLTFAAGIRQLRRFVQISTAYVAGQKHGTVTEEEPHASSYSTFYEESKAAAEDLVRASGLPFSICRPGMIVGDSERGRVRSFNTIYYVLKLMLLGKMRIFPIRPDTKLDLVPVDYVADAVGTICFSEDAEGKTFHLTCPEETAPEAEELATIRYTSGTTGEPKGVMFRYGQLGWMGEALAGLLSWKERNRPVRYLSFLPLSHVVEGILAANAPYYLLTKTDFYYLNDFGALAETLPKVRPTVFFSVPRFYEKLWDSVTGNRIGKAWLAAEEGPGKRALGRLLRNAVLKKAGLDKCGQLIVGSAPISEMLLRNFRSLGIEIYNAYGQTEAVLIGENRPYCTALIWTEGDDSGLEKEIARVNAGLSHPEQVRKYCVIPRPLSIAEGELTPNLKVKRSVVEKHFARQIRKMYR